MQPKNYYKILGVTENAATDEIRRAYRAMAKKLHPDKNPGNKKAEEAFKEGYEAYSTLIDPVKRSKYDQLLKYGYTHTNAKAKPRSQAPPRNEQPRKAYSSYTYRTKKKKNTKANASTLMAIAVIVILVVYYELSGHNDRPVVPANASASTAPQSKPTENNTYPISNADSPYDHVFGESVYDSLSRNCIYLYNKSNCEAIVCIADVKTPSRIIRNEYIDKGVGFKLDKIPDGNYCVKIYFGNKWIPRGPLPDGTMAGRFSDEKGFREYNDKVMLLNMSQSKDGSLHKFSSYEFAFSLTDTAGSRSITAEQFFR